MGIALPNQPLHNPPVRKAAMAFKRTPPLRVATQQRRRHETGQLSRRGFLKGAPDWGPRRIRNERRPLLGGYATANGSASEDQGDGDDTLAETGKPLHIGDAQADSELTVASDQTADPPTSKADGRCGHRGLRHSRHLRCAAAEEARQSSLSKADHQLSVAANGPSSEARPTSVRSAALDRPTTSIPMSR